MAKLVNNNHLIDVNFVLPESQVKTLAKLQWLLGPIIGASLLAATASLHLANTSEITSLERDTAALRQALAQAAAEDTENLVGTYRGLVAERDELEALMGTWRDAIPTPPDWEARYEDILNHLPGIGTFNPSITLSGMTATNEPSRKREDYGIPTAEYQRIYAEFTVTGTAKTKEDVTRAALAFQTSPKHAVIFTGTNTTGDGYSFNLTIGLLADPPPPDPTDGSPAGETTP